MKRSSLSRVRRGVPGAKPRNVVLVALKARGSSGAGAHAKQRGAQRRAERVALLKLVRDAQ